MTLKSIIWTTIIAVCLFFVVVYLGIKNNWVNDAVPNLSTSENVKKTDLISSFSPPQVSPILLGKDERDAALIDEPSIQRSNTMTLGSASLSIEEVVSQCQHLTESVGIPKEKIDNAMMECINRNSMHLTGINEPKVDQANIIRKNCHAAITQKEQLSTEEVKILIDECVASSQSKAQ